MESVIATYAQIIGDVLRLDMSGVVDFAREGRGGRLAVLTVLLGGLSSALGESVVLFINRVRPVRFVLSLVISAVLFLFSFTFLALSIYLVARFAFGAGEPFILVARVAALAYAPLLFAFLEFLPVLGLPIGMALRIWSLLAAFVGVSELLGLTPLRALASVAIGYLLLLTLERTVGRPIIAFSRWLRRRAAGVKLVTDRQSLRKLIDAGPDEGIIPLSERKPQEARRERKTRRRA